MESFPRAHTPEEDQALDQKTLLHMQWARHTFELWNAIEHGEVPELPTDPEEAASYVDRLLYLQEHRQEKYHDRDGTALYERLDQFIEKLKEVK